MARKRALLVGVRTYPRIPLEYGGPLAGCHNDVVHFRRVLLERGFDDANIRVLVDRMDEGCDCLFCEEHPQEGKGAPTREAIHGAVGELAATTEDGDVVVVYYSGHGSEYSGRGLHAGQRFQTLVPHDSGRGQARNRDISDREVEGWVRGLQRKTPYVTFVFDCCHSGGVTAVRGEASTSVSRRVKADERTDAAAYAAPFEDQGGEDTHSSPPPRQGEEASGWYRGEGENTGRAAIVLSASAARELSSETVADGKKQGLFTHQLTQALAGVSADLTDLTWADIFPQVAEAVTQENLSQHPRREGNGPIFEPGEIDGADVYPPAVIELKKLAVVIGIDYQADGGKVGEEAAPSFAALRTPGRDAEEVARVLEQVQGYEIVGLSRRHPGSLLGKRATRRRIHKLINRLVDVKARSQRESAVLIYFAGHGMVRSDEKGESVGYLIPWDADRADPSTWLPMKDLRDQLVDGIAEAERLQSLQQAEPLRRVTSRHLLLVLDCCFAGAMSYDFFRGGPTSERPIYYSEYKRFVEGTAWQLLTSAASNQQALDRDPNDPDQPCSPFAQALIDGLSTGEADVVRQGARADRIITASELHQYIDARLRGLGVDVQTPGLMPLRPMRGQFIFHVPGYKPTPMPDPPLHPGANPWRGGEAYGAGGANGTGGDEEDFYHGRERATLGLLECFLEAPGNVALVGCSGSGATSLVRAGLLPILEDPVGGRKRLRSWLVRSGRKHALVSRDDLKQVRQWASARSLEPVVEAWDALPENASLEVRSESERAVADAVERAVRQEGWLMATGPRAAQIQTRLEMESLGVPTFESATAQQSWVVRLDLLGLLDRPRLLCERLRFWLRQGSLADFLSLSDRGLKGLVGRWHVVFSKDEVEDAEGAADVDDEGRVLWLVDSWVGQVASSDGVKVLAVVQPDCQPPPWDLYSIPKPDRDELRAMVLGPADAMALMLEPPDLVDDLVAEVEEMPAPMPWLSARISGMYIAAWKRRG